jgi:hypothetical protein
MKIYQAQLPLTTRRLKPLTPLPPRPQPAPPPEAEQCITDEEFRAPHKPDLAHDLQRRIETVLMNGFWYCTDCDRMCERIEGEQGQPAHCDRCGGLHIVWNPPVDQVLQPEAA